MVRLRDGRAGIPNLSDILYFTFLYSLHLCYVVLPQEITPVSSEEEVVEEPPEVKKEEPPVEEEEEQDVTLITDTNVLEKLVRFTVAGINADGLRIENQSKLRTKS